VDARFLLSLVAAFGVFAPIQVAGQNRPMPAAPPKAPSSASKSLGGRLRADASLPGGCPDYGGPFEAVSEPVGQSEEFVVLSGMAPPGGITWSVYSGDPSIVAAGNATQGFIPQVFTAEGEIYSTPFTLFGVGVGRTNLIIQEISPGNSSSSTPLGSWAIGGSGGTPYLDANAMYNTCRVSADSPLFFDPANAAAQLASCGSPVVGTVTDGVSTILLQTTSGLQGTACYQITSSSGLDQGTLQPAVAQTYFLESSSPDSHFTRHRTPTGTALIAGLLPSSSHLRPRDLTPTLPALRHKTVSQ
jgi:hypothetical protein